MTEMLYEFVCRQAEMIKLREAEHRAYPGDGPTIDQADALINSLHVINEVTDTIAPSAIWDTFKASVEAEMSWLFPERDSIGEALTPALRKVQEITGNMLEAAIPGQKEQLEKYVTMSIIANAARRRVAVKGNRPSFRLLLARALYFLGGGRRK